jgi:tetratricopeptide (TPR) repeat protein
MAAEDGIEPGLVSDLLALETREQQTGFLRDAGLLNAGGLGRLLDAAEVFLGTDPSKARLTAELCIGAARDAEAPAAVPRAYYVLQQVYEVDGDFETKLRLIRAAHDGYAALGMNVEALRTNVGKMAALIELGRYQEALDAGQVVLDAVDGRGYLDVKPTSRQADLLAALVHHNRGGCLEYMGRYDETLEAYERAKQLYEALGMTGRVGQVLDNRGAVLSALGLGTEALEAHETALAIFEAAGLSLSQAMSLGNIGETHLRLANYTSALRAFERARRLLASIDSPENPADEPLLLRDTADAYLALNLHSEALAAYREADGMLQETGMSHDRARTLWGMGSSLIARSELGEAERVLAESARLFGAAGNTPMLSGVMLEQALLLAHLGDRPTAVAMARRSLEIVRDSAWPVQEIYARLGLADLLLPDLDAAESHLLAAQRMVDRVGLPQLRFRLNERLGHLRRLQGEDEEARRLLNDAVDEIERLRGAVVQDSLRAAFLMDKTSAYADLLRLHLARDGQENVLRALSVAERAKSRALVDLLTGVVRGDPSETDDPELRGRAESLQADLNAIYGRLTVTGNDPGETPTPPPILRARAAELEAGISRLRLQIASARSRDDLFGPSTTSEDPFEQTRTGTVLLAYHVVGGEILAFIGVGERVRVVRGLGTVAGIARLLNRQNVQLERFRIGQEFAKRHLARMERSMRQILARLYEELVAPLGPILEEIEGRAAGQRKPVPKLAIVPHGVLHRVPFHALFDGERYLVERFEAAYAPSATVYALCQERPTRGLDGAEIFGVEDPSIPSVATEVRVLEERLPRAEVRVGEHATIPLLRDVAPSSGALHLACHGLFRSDNPMFSALKLYDGWLTAADAMSLDLSGALVTLSACESGRGEVIGGDEVLGLTRAFLGAGAATLVVSLWLVQDDTTADMMGEYYERLRTGAGPAEALRAAQLELKQRYPHPYYWAPFVVIGKR